MYVTIFLAPAALLFFCSAVNAADSSSGNGSCKLLTPAEAFSASLYTALYLSIDPEIVNSLKIAGGEAALKLYAVLKKDLDAYGACNSEKVAMTSANALARVETLTLSDYFERVSNAMANLLYRNGFLNCDNAVAVSLKLYSHIKRALKGLDPNTFDSQLQAIARGIHTFYFDIGIPLQLAADQASDNLKSEFQEQVPETSSNDKCKAAANAA